MSLGVEAGLAQVLSQNPHQSSLIDMDLDSVSRLAARLRLSLANLSRKFLSRQRLASLVGSILAATASKSQSRDHEQEHHNG